MISAEDPRLVALIDVIRRSGAAQVQLRYSDDEKPTVWMAVVGWKMINGRPRSKGKVNVYEAAAGLDPLIATYRLAEAIFDGGQCVHCQRPTGITDDWTATMPLAEHVCWYQYDPELQTFRRSCEGEE